MKPKKEVHMTTFTVYLTTNLFTIPVEWSLRCNTVQERLGNNFDACLYNRLPNLDRFMCVRWLGPYLPPPTYLSRYFWY